MRDGWKRVNRQNPCPVCGKSDWCLISEDGRAAICPRVESNKRAGEGGYLHRLTDTMNRPRRPYRVSIKSDKLQDLTKLARQYQTEAEKTSKIEVLAKNLGLSSESLRRLGVGWYERESCWVWPLSNAQGRIVGLNRRFANGQKQIIASHKTGLYLPNNLPVNMAGMTLLVTEGGSDTAAGLDLGFWSVGRFNCTHGAGLLRKLLRDRQPSTVVIIADQGGPGKRGAEGLASALLPYTSILKVIEPPKLYKDLRDWLRGGANHREIAQLIENTEPLKLKVNPGYGR
ncbi:hypothetical protein ACFL02_00355 [Planctomycetota bacterium]